MALLHRLLALVPLLLCLVSFVLTTLGLFAGSKQGFMEDYAIVRLNTSRIGENIFKDEATSDSGNSNNKNNTDDGSLWDDIKNKWHDIEQDGKDKINNITGEIVGDLADKLGIADWYSLHIMNSCEGYFGPNATETHYQLNVTNCTVASPDYSFNLTAVLDNELSIGPLKLNLAKFQWPDSIQDRIDDLNGGLLAVFVFYVLSIGFSGLSMLACIPAILIQDHKAILVGNLVLCTLAAFCILLGSIVVTAVSSIGVMKLNTNGQKVTLVAEKGTKFYTITWIATVFMMLATFFWASQIVLLKRKLKKARGWGKEEI